MTAHAFDAVASEYDAGFTHHPLGRWLRESVRDRMGAAVVPGQHLLDLGCGTGEDALWLALRDVHVTAVDGSGAMVERARRKVEHAGAADRVALRVLDLNAGGDPLGPLGDGVFDGAYSNFGALNCVADRGALAASLAERVRTGGRVWLVVMGPVCPWEFLGYLPRLRVRTAFRRWRQGRRAALAGSASVPVWYPSPRRLRQDFQPWFRHVSTAGIGVLLPPTDFRGLVDRWPRTFRALAGVERRIAGRFPFTWLNDHYLLVLERC